MSKVLYIILISFFTFTIISCAKKSDDSSSTTSSGLFVAVGDNGKILTSSDGTTWTSRTSGTTEKLRGGAYGNSTLVVVGASGTILTSSDGTTWTSRTSGTSNFLGNVTYKNSTFMAVGNSGTILTSSDGTTWTSKTSGTTKGLWGVTYGNSTWVTNGDNGSIFTSSDGTSWDNRTSASGTTVEFNEVIYGNSTFVAFGYSGTILTSTDGTTWTSRTSGTKQWTKQLGTSSWDWGSGVTTDSSGNIYVTGFTYGDLDGNTSSGNQDIFLVKYNSSGTKQWSKQLGTSSYDVGRGVTTDSSGNIYVTGYTYGGLDGNTNSGSDDIFIVKYNSSGTKQWTKQLGTSSWDWGSGVTTDSSGNIYVTGSTNGGLDGNTSSGGYDIILVKYNSSGTKQWTKQLGTSSSDDRGNGVTTDSSGNIYVTGGTYGGLDGNTSSGSDDFFLVKYNSSGTKQWTKQLGTSSLDRGFGVTTDSSGNIYVTGRTGGGLDGNTTSGMFDIFLVKYNSSGIKQ